MKITIVSLALSLGLAGCATPTVMLKNEASGQIARCGGGSTGFMAGGLIGHAIESSYDEKCVRDFEAQGFRRTGYQDSGHVSRNVVAPIASPLPVGSTLAVAGLKAESKFMTVAETLAKSNNCAQPATAMIAKGAGQESFIVGCPNGTSMAIRCEVTGCRVLQ